MFAAWISRWRLSPACRPTQAPVASFMVSQKGGVILRYRRKNINESKRSRNRGRACARAKYSRDNPDKQHVLGQQNLAGIWVSERRRLVYQRPFGLLHGPPKIGGSAKEIRVPNPAPGRPMGAPSARGHHGHGRPRLSAPARRLGQAVPRLYPRRQNRAFSSEKCPKQLVPQPDPARIELRSTQSFRPNPRRSSVSLVRGRRAAAGVPTSASKAVRARWPGSTPHPGLRAGPVSTGRSGRLPHSLHEPS